MFGTTEDQQDLIDTVRRFAAERIAPHALEWDRTHEFPLDVLAEAGGLGLGGIYVEEDDGGSGLARRDAVLVFEELAKADPTVAAYISIHNMVAWMVGEYGDEAQRERWLPELTPLTALGAYCLTEPGAGSDAAALSTRAVRDGGDYVLTGTKQFISAAGAAAVYIVMARTGGPGPAGISAFLVPGDAPGLGFGPLERKMGWNAQPTRQVLLDGVRVPAAGLLGGEGEGFRIAMQGLNGGRLNIGACSIGGGQAGLEASVAYVRERHAFGGPLAEKDTVRFALADMDTELETARALLWRAADALDAHHPEALRLCAMAKRVATEAGYRVVDSALQLHGGYGYLSEYGIEKLERDLRVHRILEGTNEVMRLIVARILLEDRHYG